MAVAVEERDDPAAKFGSQVDEQIAQATGRIRAHDLMLGGLSLAALAAVYATAMIVIDQSFNLPEWVRQLALAVFLVVLAGTCYWLLIRPLRKRINPLYAAARVELTLDDPKNSVTGYVETREKGEVHNAVKTAMGARAARAVGDADVNKAVDHRGLIAAGGVLILFLLVLAVLFFVFRPAQFSSLMNRALFPFSSDPIAKRTVISIVKPEPPDPTITTGQTIAVAVHVTGQVPNRNAPDRVRLLLRHNPADPNFEEIAMEEGETSRDWHVKVPDYLVQNGFWYKVAAGDNETPEYRVTVRTLPMFETYETTYEYPAYTRKPKDKATGPNLRAYKGTKVTLIGNTNREVKEGVMKFDAANLAPVVGKPVPGRPNSLEFKFTATESSRYKLFLVATNGERNTDAPAFSLTLDTDLAPIVQITEPQDAETTAVANGQLKLDGTVGDDFGIDKVRLRMRIDGPRSRVGPVHGRAVVPPREGQHLADRPHVQAFRRPAGSEVRGRDEVPAALRRREPAGHRILGRGHRQLHRGAAGRRLGQAGRQCGAFESRSACGSLRPRWRRRRSRTSTTRSSSAAWTNNNTTRTSRRNSTTKIVVSPKRSQTRRRTETSRRTSSPRAARGSRRPGNRSPRRVSRRRRPNRRTMERRRASHRKAIPRRTASRMRGARKRGREVEGWREDRPGRDVRPDESAQEGR